MQGTKNLINIFPLIHFLTLPFQYINVHGFLFHHVTSTPKQTATQTPILSNFQSSLHSKVFLYINPSDDEIELIELHEQIKSIAYPLWKSYEESMPLSSMINDHPTIITSTSKQSSKVKLLQQGEASLPKSTPYSKRLSYFHSNAMQGCPKAQHSYALLLWNGFGGMPSNPIASARWHAASALQYHLDGMALLGGCLRTGTGVQRNVMLGLKLIDYCASHNNPSGINKQAAIMESNQNDLGARQLYEECRRSGNVNSLLYMNLGWSYLYGNPYETKKENNLIMKGMECFHLATQMAPDEGSEEAAWYLYQEYKDTKWKDAIRFLKLSADLGYHDAIEEFKKLP